MNSKMEKPNSGDHRLVFSGTEETLHLVDNASPPDPPGAPLLLMRTGIFEFGRNRSWMSGTTTPVPEDISSLEDHARSMARNSYRDRFDPEKNVHDRMHQAEYERLLEVRGEIEKGVAQATANVHESELVLANTGKAGPKPQASGWLAA